MLQGSTDFRTVNQVLKLWRNKLYEGYPHNKEASQILRKTTKYAGCTNAASSGDKKCTVSVCLYVRAGNSGMGQLKSWEDHQEKINNGPACGPCPEDEPDCGKCNTQADGPC